MFLYGAIFPKLAVGLLLAAVGGGLAGGMMAVAYLSIRRLWYGSFSWREAKSVAARWGVMGACIAAGLAAVLVGFELTLHILS